MLLALTLLLAAHPDAQSLATRIEAGIARGENSLTPNVDFDVMIDTALKGLEVPPGFRDGMVKGAKETPTGAGIQLANAVKNGATFKLLRLHEVGGQTRALYRLIMPEGGVNYIDVVFSDPAKPPLRVVDLEIANQGEQVTAAHRRAAMMAIAENQQGLLDRLAGKEKVFLNSLPTLKAMNAAAIAQEWPKVMSLYDGLPPAMKTEKTFMRLRVAAAQTIDDETYVEAIEAMAKAHPNDPATELALIDGLLLRKKFEGSLAAIDRLDARIGGDAYLEVLRSGVYTTWGKRPETKAALERATTKEPSLQQPYWSLVALALEDKKFGEVATLLNRIEKNTSLTIAPVNELPADYAPFVASKEGKAWAKSRAKKKG